MDTFKYDIKVDPLEQNSSHMALANRIEPNERVLDLGCATGYFSQLLKQQKNCYVVGIDNNEAALEKAGHYCDQVFNADLEGKGIATQLAGQTFDVLVFSDVLEHLKDPVIALKQLTPLLKKNGRILISIPNIAHASIRLELLQGHFDYQKLGLLDKTHLRFYTRSSLFNMLMEAGFVCTDIDYTVHDLADETIIDQLNNMGLEPSVKTLEKLHEPEAQAYQIIAEACRVNKDVINYRCPELEPKPLDSSNTYYSQKQERIEILQAKLNDMQLKQDELQLTLDNVQKNYSIMEKQCGDMDSLYENLQRRVNELTNLNNHLIHEKNHSQSHVERLESVLNRIHNKKSYRLLQIYRRMLYRLKSWLTNQTTADEKTQDLIDYFDNYQEWVDQCDNFNVDKRLVLQNEIEQWDNPPKIAILMPVYNTDKNYLTAAIESVLNQVYPYWELCIADDASDLLHVREVLETFEQQDERIKVTFLDKNSHIAEASNTALTLVTAENVALMDHDDVLAPDALFWVAKNFIEHPSTKLMYSDEDKIDLHGRRYNAYFKSDWNPALSLSHNFICHLGVYKSDLVKKIGGFRSGFNGAQDYDLMLRYVELIEPEEIFHIPKVLYHWRAIPGSTAIGLQEKPYAELAILRAVSEAMQRRGCNVNVMSHETLPGAVRVKYDLPSSIPLVSIIIPTRNAYNLIRRCISSILTKTTYQNYEILVIDNGSDEIETLSFFRYIQRQENIRVIRDDRPFNYASLNNEAVKQAKGSVIALLNNDVEIITPDWLEEMVSHAIRPEIGAVGAKLYYPNDTVQHAGVIIGLGGVAGHSHKHFPRHDRGYSGRLHLIQNLSAVTAACMVLKKSVYEQVNGFDEENLKVAFNDVDLCLRIGELGYNNLWTPYAELYHFESATRGFEDTPEKQARFNQEIQFMKNKWGDKLLQDPAYNPNLTLNTEDFALNWP